jgi:RND family efflux transporter MFP subunit
MRIGNPAFIILLAPALLIACKGDAAEEAGEVSPPATVAVSVEPATSRTFTETVDAVGTTIVRVGHGASLSAPAQTRVTKVHVTVGQHVGSGHALLEFERTPFESALRSAEATLAAAEKAAERAQRLADAGVVARKEAETAQAELARAQAEAVNARRNLELTTLRAPMAGVITKVNTTIGSGVDAGQIIVEMADPDALDVLLILSLNDATRARVGQAVALYEGSAAEGTPVARGRVADVAATVDSANQGVIARVALVPSHAAVRIGETLFGRITVAEHRGAVVIPLDALVPDGEEFHVFVVDDDGMAIARSVTVGGRSDHDAWIRAGLKAGERVVTRGAYGVTDSSKVVTGRGEK